MENNTSESTQSATWICSVCGYQHVGPNPPKKCPQCGVDDIYFDKVISLRNNTKSEQASHIPDTINHDHGEED